jgi:hypothetical protein
VKRRILVNALLALVCAVGVAAASGTSDTPKAKKASAKVAKAKANGAEYGNWTGCLRVDGDGRGFVLTDVKGPGAPGGRNWKTAFITKKKGKFDVIAPDLRLKDKVGKTVQLTGRRDETTLRPHAIRVLGASCG